MCSINEDFLVKEALYLNFKIASKGKVTWICSVKYILQSINESMIIQARRKQYRVDPTKIGSSAKGAGTLEGSGGMPPREILKFSFSKIHIWHILREN